MSDPGIIRLVDTQERILAALEEANRLKRLELRLQAFRTGVDYDTAGWEAQQLEIVLTAIINHLEPPT